ncbi:hypothetical protein [Streptomyces decoyicus]|uniref:Uncharacterized protein n=1 Tax=Streptomyces decoyicus TaxID=249567 RepID=A0ABZ1FD38_9ACTN|nr:hypothetical protein [Streptomyces decoyicus]WSB68257.1 hypothetical protein OG863_09975 [Streptomyces decoyicus]
MLTGLSSGTAPDLSAIELADLVLRNGGTAVDLRVGKGHRWEEQGTPAFRDAGVDIAFLGTGIVLGDPAYSPASLGTIAGIVPGLPVKVFARAGCTRPEALDLTQRQVSVLAAHLGSSGRVLVETHRGYAPVGELRRLSRLTGIRLLLDTLGLAQIAGRPSAAAAQLADVVSAAQIKGFDWNSPLETRHCALASVADRTQELLARLPHLASVTVETRAGSGAEDLRLINNWW